ncbi:Two component signal transduction histidine kinase [Modestobacter italicus]|uniref:histidine kinase n=1 Tax=Modestobacter italicus (strain DSM 44449 / CECT 9708 / BC 501) TaxID=2732864 RepID=I4EUH7_MODI5|nr:Two component signal transduction histidine kinase [Modestobacter marinus]
MGTALLSALFVNVAFSNRFDSYLEQQRSARVQQIAGAVTGVYESARRWDGARMDELAPALAMAGADVVLTDVGGRTIWSTDRSGSEMAEMHRAMTESGPLTEPVSVPVTVDGRQRATLEVSLPEGSVPVADQQFRAGVNRLLLAGGLVVAVVASALGLVFARRVTRPVAELTAAARDLHAGNRDRRAAVTGRDEVAQLGQAFNELAESAQRQEVLRQSFAADVAHELRTPLAILRSQLEAVQDGVLNLTPALVTSLHEETLRLGRLVADLETLTTAEAVSFSLERVPVDVADVVRSVVTGLGPRLTDAGLTLDPRLVPAPVCGDPTRLAQVVTNLLTNAMKFVPAGGRVTVTTDVVADRVRLTVRDDGPGIPDGELSRVFDRYFRGSGAGANGSGVGLAVVAALVQAHGGAVEAANACGGGAVLGVTLPLAGQDPGVTASGRSAGSPQLTAVTEP